MSYFLEHGQLTSGYTTKESALLTSHSLVMVGSHDEMVMGQMLSFACNHSYNRFMSVVIMSWPGDTLL